MNRTLIKLSLACCAVMIPQLRPVYAEPQGADKELMEKVQSSVVEIRPGKQHAQSGVIVSAHGHVVWNGHPDPTSDITVRLFNGELVKATNLGWSEEFKLGLLKLKGDRTYPEVRIHQAYEPLDGEKCIEVGYRHAGANTPATLETRSAEVLFSEHDHWLLTNLEPTPFEYGAGLFNQAGELVGLSVPGVSTEHHVCVASEVVRKQAKHLSQGKNLDWIRFPPTAESAYQKLSSIKDADSVGMVRVDQVEGWTAPAEKRQATDFQIAQAVARKVTVKITRQKNGVPEIRRRFAKNTSLSGVVVSKSGLIATCGHSLLLPGDEVEISFSDGRKATAVALWMDWVSDVGLLQVNQKGDFESARLSPSSDLAPDGAVHCAAYPLRDVDGKPVAVYTTEVLSLQQTPYVGWNDRILLRRSLSLSGGASGGGVFDENGGLVGILLGPGEVFRSEALATKIEELSDSEGALPLSRPSL